MHKAMQKRSFWLLCFSTLVVFVLLVSLGNWQMRRLSWKLQLIADVNSRITQPPVAAPGPADWAGISRDKDAYRAVSLTGTYDHSKEVHVWFLLNDPQGGTFSGPGYLLLTHVKTSEGWDVIVNRGFVPEGKKEPQSRPETLVDGPRTLVGLVRFDEPKNWLTPKADKIKNVWIARHVEEMAAFMGLDPRTTAPYWIDLTKGQGVNGLPQGGETRVTFRNAHLQYAVTWYGLALVLVVICVILLRKMFRKSTDSAHLV